MPAPATVTGLLAQWKDGDRAIENQLVAQIYPVLKGIAEQHLRRNASLVTLRPTALVHDAYERLLEQKGVGWQNRDHFFAIASTILRRVLVDHVRQRHAEKRGGDVAFVGLEDAAVDTVAAADPLFDCLALDQGLTKLAELDPAAARVVELRLFSGLGVEQIAALCGASISTVSRRWRFARAWLGHALGCAPVRDEP